MAFYDVIQTQRKIPVVLDSVRPSGIKNAKKLLDGAQNRCSMSEISTVRHILGHFIVGRFTVRHVVHEL